jgi:CheY-like chemotaxis protein
MRLTLESEGYFVLSTREGSEAVDMALGMMPDIIILDAQIPDVSGWEILKTLKTDAEVASIPVVICSADADAEQANNSGAVGFIRKPLEAQEILAAIKRATGLPHYSQ